MLNFDDIDCDRVQNFVITGLIALFPIILLTVFVYDVKQEQNADRAIETGKVKKLNNVLAYKILERCFVLRGVNRPEICEIADEYSRGKIKNGTL